MAPSTDTVNQLTKQLNEAVERTDKSGKELQSQSAPWDKNKSELERLTNARFYEWEKQLNAIHNDRGPLKRILARIGSAYYFIGSIPSRPGVRRARRHIQYLRYKLIWFRFLSLLIRLGRILLWFLFVTILAGLLYLICLGITSISTLIDPWFRSFPPIPQP